MTMIKKILEFKSPKRHYKADACIVWCFDARFGKLLAKFLKARKFGYCDIVLVGGGAKSLADQKDKIGRTFLLGQIKTSLRLHHTKLVVLMTHSDCGAYGGLKTFKNDTEFEKRKHIGYLRAAKKFLRAKPPRSVKVETAFADFDGLSQV